MHRLVLPVLACFALGGCGASSIVGVVTAPVKAAGKAVDMATTSQSEADEKRGRKLRKLEERYGRLERDWRKEDRRCNDGRTESCERREAIAAEMAEIAPRIPAPAN